MGPTNSATWNLLLDGAESILKEEGYAELTSRRLAERVGVKQQLVYYYFKTMDALMVEAFRRLAKRDYERLKEVLASDQPLHQFWDMRSHEGDARLIAEFMALANRSQGVKKEVIDFIEKTRRMQSAAIAKAIKALKKNTGVAALSPGAITFLVTSVALALTRESALGISTAHAEIEKLIGECLSALEPGMPKPRRVSKRG
jgi:AcrR family transcriptional regulator